MDTVVIDSGKSQIKQVSKLFNYPGINEVSGSELLEKIKEQAVTAGTEWFEGIVESVEQEESVFEVSMSDGRKLETKYLVITTNIQTSILESRGFEPSVNEKMPSGKIKKVLGIDPDGKTPPSESIYHEFACRLAKSVGHRFRTRCFCSHFHCVRRDRQILYVA